MADEEARLAAKLKLLSDKQLEERLEEEEERWVSKTTRSWEEVVRSVDVLAGVANPPRFEEDTLWKEEPIVGKLQLILNERKERLHRRRDLVAHLKHLSDKKLVKRLVRQKKRLRQAESTISLARKNAAIRPSKVRLSEARLRKNRVKEEIQVIRNERRERDCEREKVISLHEALREAREKLETWQTSGRALARAMAQIVKYEKEEEKESTRDGEDSALLREWEEKHATVVSELQRVEEENSRLRESVTSEQVAALGLRHDLSELESEVSQLESDKETLLGDLEVAREKRMCQICFEEPRNTVVLPCLHFLFCNSCMQQHRDQNTACPTCRVPMAGSMALYLP